MAGGFTLGQPTDHLGLCIRLARASRARVFSVDYRLAPEHVFPAAVEDAVAAYRYLLATGYLPAPHSPGGHLCGRNARARPSSSRPRARRTPPPGSGLHVPGDRPAVPRRIGHQEPGAGLDHPGPSPCHPDHLPCRSRSGRSACIPGSRHASRSLPRLYIQVGTHELLLSDIGTFVEKARWAGVPVQVEIWEGMFHCWQVFAGQLPEGQEAVDHAGAFIRNVQAR